MEIQRGISHILSKCWKIRTVKNQKHIEWVFILFVLCISNNGCFTKQKPYLMCALFGAKGCYKLNF